MSQLCTNRNIYENEFSYTTKLICRFHFSWNQKSFAQTQQKCLCVHVLIKCFSKWTQFITLLFTAFQYHITFNLVFISYLFARCRNRYVPGIILPHSNTCCLCDEWSGNYIKLGKCQTIVFRLWHVLCIKSLKYEESDVLELQIQL